MMSTRVQKRASGTDDACKKKQKGETGDGQSAEKEKLVYFQNPGLYLTPRRWIYHFDQLLSIAIVNIPIPLDYRGYELLELVERGHPEPEKIIGCGVEYFTVHTDEMCNRHLTFVAVRKDGSMAKFCYRSCFNNITPFPEDAKDLGGGVAAVCLCHLGGPSGLRLDPKFGAIRLSDEEVVEGTVTLGPAKFRPPTNLNMFQCFNLLLLTSPLNKAFSETHHLLLLDLLKKGDPEWEKKIGSGVESFQVRIHPMYDSRLRSFFLVRGDGSVEDFCYMNCVNNIVPMPEEFIEKFNGPCTCHHQQDGEGGVVTLGMHKFQTSAEIVGFLRSLLSQWPDNEPTINCELLHNRLWNLLRKGDPEWGEKETRFGSVKSFIIRQCQSAWHRRSFFIVWENGSIEPFDVMTCVDNILPLSNAEKHLSANYVAARGAGKSPHGGGRKGSASKGTRGRGRGRRGLPHTLA